MREFGAMILSDFQVALRILRSAMVIMTPIGTGRLVCLSP